jgi:CubicO group peptidase (beta-lactamase class C family)
MTVTRRQFVQGLVTALLSVNSATSCTNRSNVSFESISEILERATTPGWFRSREVNAAVLDICCRNRRFTKAYGDAVNVDQVFVIASITKPIIATAAMVLKDRGKLALEDRAVNYVPEFNGEWRKDITIQNLLTHTAGLPDVLPQMHEMTAREATLEEMFAATCKVPLLFKPGTAVSYSNLGVLVVKEILERISGTPLREFLKREIFDPLAMNASSLGLGGRPISSIAQTQRSNPDTYYQYDLGAPWGGVFSTASDLTRFLHYFVDPARAKVLEAATAREMLVDHCRGLNQPWGIGWMLANSHDCSFNVRPSWHQYGWKVFLSNPESGPAFGSHCSAAAFGHYGVSGTIAWADPQSGISMVLLTTKHVRYSRDGVLGPVSDRVSQL